MSLQHESREEPSHWESASCVPEELGMKVDDLASVLVCSNLRLLLEVKIVDGRKALCLLVTTGHRTLTGWSAHDTGWWLTHTRVPFSCMWHLTSRHSDPPPPWEGLGETSERAGIGKLGFCF